MNIVPASIGKRSGAAFIDILIALILWVGVFSYVVEPVVRNSFDLAPIQENLATAEVDSHLYYYSSDTASWPVALTSKTDLTSDDLLTALHDYYVLYKTADEGQLTTAEFNAQILDIGTDDSLFIYQQDGENNDLVDVIGVVKPIDNASSLTSSELVSASSELVADVLSFLTTEYNTAATDFAALDRITAITDVLSKFSLMEVAITLLVGIVLLYMLIPLLMKDGRTLGKQIFGLSVVNKDGYAVKKWQLIVRALAFGVIEIVGSLYTMLGAILISYTIMIFGKKNMALHDFVAGTRVIDGKRSIWYKNAAEKEAAEKAAAAAPSLVTDFVPPAPDGGSI